MNQKLLISLFAILISSVASGDGQETHNGGFADQIPRQLLLEASNELVTVLNTVSDETLFASIQGRRADLIRAVTYDRLIQLPLENRTREERLLQLDYDVSSWTLVILQPFYVSFSNAWDATLQRSAKARMKELLLHEAGHLFGLDEEQSEQFSSKFVARTTTGSVFTRDTNHPALGEAWRDPSGVIWGSPVKNRDGSFYHPTQPQAQAYCQSRGAELPTRADFVRLAEYMGGHPGYRPQILPELDNQRFWSSTISVEYPWSAYHFAGYIGGVYLRLRGRTDDTSVRCVVRN